MLYLKHGKVGLESRVNIKNDKENFMQKPSGVKIIAILLGITGTLSLVSGFSLITAGFNSWGLSSIIAGFITVIGAFGAWTLKRWAWFFLIGIIVYQGFFFMFAWRGLEKFVFIPILVGVIYYLFQIKESFNR